MHDVPFILKLRNESTLIVEEVPVVGLPELYEFFCTYAKYKNGVSEDEFVDEDDFVTKSAQRINFSLREVDSKRLVAYVQVNNKCRFFIFY